MNESCRATPTHVEIDLPALRHNFQALRKRVGERAKLLAVVKSNAYGHGAVPVARLLQLQGADNFGVGTVDEGILLREAGIKKPILVMLGLIEGKYAELVRYQLTPVVYELREALALQKFLELRREKLEVHIKVDTGMTRLGVLLDEAPRFFDELKRLENLRPTGLMTHLADADDQDFTVRQGNAFERCRAQFQNRFAPAVCHVANSLASVDRRFTEYDLVRLGIVLYGAYPVPRQKKMVELEPVMRWKSRIISIKKVPKGTAISYGRTFIADRASKIGVIPVGYADGYHRRLSNRASVLVRGVRVPIVGTICMDTLMVDLSKIPAAQLGDEVVLLGKQGRETITAEELGKLAETISYEIFCHVSERVPRSYLDSNHP